MLGILIALVSAALSGWASVAQQRVASAVPVEDGGTLHLLGRLLVRPLWLFAFGVNMAGFATHTWALDRGGLLTVEPVISTTLLFALAFGAWWAHERLPTTVWVASAFLVGGLALFLVAGDASGTGDDASDLRWMMAGVVVVPIVVVLALFAYRRTGPARAVAFGIVAGILFGMQSSLLKAVTLDWGTGLIDELGSWKPWAVIIAGVGGFLMQQAAFQSGSIALSLPPTVVFPPLTAAAVAIFVLGGSINMSGLHGVAVVAAVLAIIGGQVAIAKVEAAREQAKAATSATPGTS